MMRDVVDMGDCEWVGLLLIVVGKCFLFHSGGEPNPIGLGLEGELLWFGWGCRGPKAGGDGRHWVGVGINKVLGLRVGLI